MTHQKPTQDHGATARRPSRRAALTASAVAVAAVGLVITGMPQGAIGMSVRAVVAADHASNVRPVPDLAPPAPTGGSATGSLTGLLGSTPTTLNILGLLPTTTTTTTTTTTAPTTPTTAPPTTPTTTATPPTVPIHVPVTLPTIPTVAPTPTTAPTATTATTKAPKPTKATKKTPAALSNAAPSTTSTPTKKKGAASKSSATTSTIPGTTTTTFNRHPQPAKNVAPPPAPVALSSIAADCSVDVSTALTNYLAQLPSGATFASPPGACYQVDDGVTISHPLTVNGGTWKDMTDTGTGQHQNYRPIISVREGDNVTLENLTVEGANTTRGFKAPRVGQAGIKVLSSSNVNITNVTATDTFGDGLELVADMGRPWRLGGPTGTPDSDITVNGFSSLLSGRCGLTPAEVVDSTFNNLYLYESATRSIDFESDIQGVGSGNDTFDNTVASHGINMVETLHGPITFDHTSMNGRFFLSGEVQGETVTYENGSFECDRRAPGSCVNVKDGTLEVTGTTLTYRPGVMPVTEVGYHAYPGAQVNVS